MKAKNSVLKILSLSVVFMMLLTVFSVSSVASTLNQMTTISKMDDGLGDVDQKQEKEDGAKSFYNNTWLAQKFHPDADNLTGVSVRVYKYTKKTRVVDRGNGGMSGLFSKFRIILRSLIKKFSLGFLEKWSDDGSDDSLFVLDGDGPQSLTISIYKSLSGEPLRSKTFSADEVGSSPGWLVFDFSDNPFYDAFEDNTFYIVCHAAGGDKNHCFNWSSGSGNPYGWTGDSFISRDNGSYFDTLEDVDFCFRSYGTSWSEQPDGIVKRYAIMIHGPDETEFKKSCEAIKKVLCSNVWDKEVNGEQRMWIFSRVDSVEANDLIRDLDHEKENADDIILLFYSGHTACPFYNKYVDRLGGQVVVILDTCYAGRYSGRFVHAEMLMSSKSDEKSYGKAGGIGCFTEQICDALGGYSSVADSNHDGWVSAREAYNYARYRTGHGQHPQFYDGHPGDILLVRTTS